MSLGDSLDLPFEETPPGMTLDENVVLSGGLVVMGAVVPVPSLGPKPALVFRFAAVDGTFLPAVVLVLDVDQAEKTPQLVAAATAAAVRAAREARS